MSLAGNRSRKRKLIDISFYSSKCDEHQIIGGMHHPHGLKPNHLEGVLSYAIEPFRELLCLRFTGLHLRIIAVGREIARASRGQSCRSAVA